MLLDVRDGAASSAFVTCRRRPPQCALQISDEPAIGGNELAHRPSGFRVALESRVQVVEASAIERTIGEQRIGQALEAAFELRAQRFESISRVAERGLDIPVSY